MEKNELFVQSVALFQGVVLIVLAMLLIYGILLTVKALKKYNAVKSETGSEEKMNQSLGEVLKEHRQYCHMTQEYVAESLNVSRQAVSKWENGISEPGTSNLIALAKLYGVSVEELLKKVK